MKTLSIFLFTLMASVQLVFAQDTWPSINPSALYVTPSGEEIDDASSEQNAPLVAHFYANPEDVGDYTVRYEWTITRMGQAGNEVIVHRFDENLDYTFSESGTFAVRLYATFVLAGDTITLPDEGEDNPIMVSISESKLEFPNAFSPNGDGYNDVFKAKEGYQSIVSFEALVSLLGFEDIVIAKEGYQSIVSFEASIFNRWGQRLYSWDTLDGSWDGKYNGRTVGDGVYYLVVTAKGADGKKYNIRKTVNVLTGYDKTSKTGGSDD